MPFFQGMNLVGTKEGALVPLRAVLDSPYPVVVHWEIGEGSALAQTPDWNGYWVGGVTQWEYYIDYVANLNLPNAGAAVPQDLACPHLDIRDRVVRRDRHRHGLRHRLVDRHGEEEIPQRGRHFSNDPRTRLGSLGTCGLGFPNTVGCPRC
jgi:hypothetical protein